VAVLKSRKNTNKKSKWARTYKLSVPTCHFITRVRDTKTTKPVISSRFPFIYQLRRDQGLLLDYFHLVS